MVVIFYISRFRKPTKLMSINPTAIILNKNNGIKVASSIGISGTWPNELTLVEIH